MSAKVLVGFFKSVRIVSAFTDFRVDAFLRIVFMVIVAVLSLFLVSTSMMVQS